MKKGLKLSTNEQLIISECLPHNSTDVEGTLSRNVRDVDVGEAKKIFRENRVDRMEALNSFIVSKILLLIVQCTPKYIF